MWIGKIEELSACEFLSEETKLCLANFIKTNDMSVLPNGRYDLGNGNYANVFEYDTKETDGVFEAHKVFIDIHYAISGEEKILYADSYEQETKPYQVDGDYSLGVVSNPKEIVLGGRVCLFATDEPHKAGVMLGVAQRVKKVVFKLKEER